MEWPLFDLRLACGPVTLRPVTDDDARALAAVLPDDLELDPHQERFAGLDPARDRERRFVQGFWRSRGAWSPESWCLDLRVDAPDVVDGPAGVQTLEGDHFADLRTVDTASWLVPSVRGQGLGTAMRAAVLGLAFDHLGAVAAISSAVLDNHASLAVSRRLGYVDNGRSRIRTESGPAELQHLRLTRERWRADAHPVEVSGVEPCRPWFGAG